MLGAGACGFRPLYREGGGAEELLGSVSLQEAASPEDFAYRERLRRRFGLTGGGADGGGAARRLVWRLTFEETGVAITRSSDITRYQVTARAEYRLLRSDAADYVVIEEGEVKAIGAYDATASVFAARTARRDERARLSTELAELTATRLLATAAREGSREAS